MRGIERAVNGLAAGGEGDLDVGLAVGAVDAYDVGRGRRRAAALLASPAATVPSSDCRRPGDVADRAEPVGRGGLAVDGCRRVPPPRSAGCRARRRTRIWADAAVESRSSRSSPGEKRSEVPPPRFGNGHVGRVLQREHGAGVLRERRQAVDHGQAGRLRPAARRTSRIASAAVGHTSSAGLAVSLEGQGARPLVAGAAGQRSRAGPGRSRCRSGRVGLTRNRSGSVE